MLTSKELKERKSECLSHYENETEIIVSMPVDDLIKLIENQEKLEKAIEILKIKLKLYFSKNTKGVTINAILPLGVNDLNNLTQNEYELLKEVLRNGN